MEEISSEIIQNECHNIINNTINNSNNNSNIMNLNTITNVNANANSNINTNTNTITHTNASVRKNLSEGEKNEKSEKENLVHGVTTLRANFKKSNTCGSLYVRCGCSEQNLAESKSAVIGGSNGNLSANSANKQKSQPLQTPVRRVKLYQSYSHPDTTIVFTDENKYADQVEASNRLRSKIISTRSGNVEISKRMSTPNFGNYTVLDVAIHPEIVLKLAQKHPNLSAISAHKPIRPILKKSSHSFPGLASRNSDYTYDALINQTFSSSQSFEEETETDVEADVVHKDSDLKDSSVTQPQQIQPSAPLPPVVPAEVPVVKAVAPPPPTSAFQVAPPAAAAAALSTPVVLPTPPIIAPQISLAALTIAATHQVSEPTSVGIKSEVNESAGAVSRKPPLPLSLPPSLPPAEFVNPAQRNINTAEQFFKDSGILGPMGNGVSGLLRRTSKIVPINDPHVKEQIRKNSFILTRQPSEIRRKSIPDNYDYFQSLVLPQPPAREWENRIALLENEIDNLKVTLRSRDEEISKLRREIHKLKSVLQLKTAATINNQVNAGDGDLLSSLQTLHGMPGQQVPVKNSTNSYLKASVQNNNSIVSADLNAMAVQMQHQQHVKKQGVSGESTDITGQQSSDILIPKYDKDFRSKQLIKDAIMDNDFLKNIDSLQIREIVDSMYNLEVAAGEYVIREGDAGAHLYVSAQGQFEVIKDNKQLGYMGPGKAFGELAILYNCTRTASIRVLTDARVWVLDRRVFQQIMMRTGMQRLEENVKFLKSVPLLKNLSNDVLTKIADVLEVEFYLAGAYIIRQGAGGDTFFLISQGNVKVTQRLPNSQLEEEIRTLSRGEYFGEQALIKEDYRTASVIAMSPGVECLTLDRASFIQHIGDLCELHEKDYGDEQRVFAFQNLDFHIPALDSSSQELLDIDINDLDVVATLGVGGFGRVELVKYVKDNTIQTYALKCMKKQHIVDTHQEEHVFSEKKIMLSCNSPFICRLYRTYRDYKYVYMLLEACMGGEVWTILRDRTYFDDPTTQFIIGCVLQAFEYLHARGIVYRDLKPENLLLDARGYVKLVDFGFAKFIGYSCKTWTFCGTPEYVAPEIILNKGHDRAVDYWALGVLIHELLTGTPPFTASDPMKTYNIILKGIDMVDFPRHMSRNAISLIKKLCRDVPAERLGYQRGGIQDIKKYKWFQGFDWDGLANLTLTPPIISTVAGPLDMSNFDMFPSEVNFPPDEFSGWDDDF